MAAMAKSGTAVSFPYASALDEKIFHAKARFSIGSDANYEAELTSQNFKASSWCCTWSANGSCLLSCTGFESCLSDLFYNCDDGCDLCDGRSYCDGPR